MTKRFLIILVFGLLVCSNSNAASIWDFLHIGMTKKQVSKHVQGRGIGWNLKSGKGSKYHATKEMQRIRSLYADRVGGVFYGSVEKIYYPEYKTEILTHWHNGGDAPDIFPFYIFENVTVPQSCSSIWHCMGSYGNGTLKAVVFTRHEALITADPTYLARKQAEEAKKKTVAKKPEKKKPGIIIGIPEGYCAVGNELKPCEEIAEKPEETKPDDGKIIIIGSGSGFFVTDQGHVVSNDHVIGICKKVITYEEGEEITLKILATDMVNDLGLIKGKFQSVNYLNIKPDGAELGEDIVAFGYPLSRFTSDSVKLTKGIVSSLSGPGNNYSQIQIDAAIQPGSSGGPILNMNGQVIGVAVSGLSKKLLAQEVDYIPENVNFAVAAQSLMSFLKGNKISVGTGASRTLSTKELAKIGEPATIQLFCMNTREAYAKLKKANKHSDVLLDLQ